MSIVICFNNKDPEPWQRQLQQKLEGVGVEIYPNVRHPEDISFALCWKPDKNILRQFSNLQVIQSVGAAVDHIIQSQDLSADYILTRIVDERLSEDMFEFVLTGVMAHMKQFSAYRSDQKEKNWKQRPYNTVGDTTIAILGLGKIGAYVSAKLATIGFRVKAWSKSKKSIEGVRCYHGEEGFKKTLNGSDILINILPLTPETENILNREHLGQLSKNGYLINVGRGEHLVDAHLIELIEKKHLSGALLDVFRKEPLPHDHVFWQYDQITITPHIASITNIDTASNIVVSNYKKFLKGEELSFKVSLKKGY